MKIALLGYGKMGKAIEQIALEHNHTIDLKVNSSSQNFDLKQLKSCDVAIEFSRPELATDNIKKCFSVNVPVVVGTTGWYDQFDDISQMCRQNEQSLFYATNFSIGVNIFFVLNRHLSKLMNPHTTYEVEMTEIHHIQKLDSPSGTAITLANGIIENLERKKSWTEANASNEVISIKSIREKDVPGTHIIKYESDIDLLEIKHEAKNRRGFATGAVLAAEWIINKKGVFTMKDLLNL